MDNKSKRGDIILAFEEQQRNQAKSPSKHFFTGVRAIASKLALTPSYVSKSLHQYYGVISATELLKIIGYNPELKELIIGEPLSKDRLNDLGDRREAVWDILIKSGYMDQNGILQAQHNDLNLHYLNPKLPRAEYFYVLSVVREIWSKPMVKLDKRCYLASPRCKKEITRIIKERTYFGSYDLKQTRKLLKLIDKKESMKRLIKVGMGRRPSISCTLKREIIDTMNTYSPDHYEIETVLNKWTSKGLRSLLRKTYKIKLGIRSCQQFFKENMNKPPCDQ